MLLPKKMLKRLSNLIAWSRVHPRDVLSDSSVKKFVDVSKKDKPVIIVDMTPTHQENLKS